MSSVLQLLGFLVLFAVAAVSESEGSSPLVQMETSLGTLVIELQPAEAPVTVENFLKYVNSGYYSGTIFHRVIDGFMVQGGGFTEDMRMKTNAYPPIALESRNGLRNEKYTVAMARTNVPDSATSQFFINVVDNPRLDFPNPDGHGYAVFGRVIQGTDVVDKIRQVPTTNRGSYEDVPMEAVIIRSVETVDPGEVGSSARQSK